MNGDLKELSRNQLAEFAGQFSSPLVGFVPVNDDTEGINGIAVDQHVEFDQVARPISVELVVHAGVTTGNGFQPVVKVQDDFA